MSYQETERGELREYLSVLRARKWTILTVLLLVTAIAAFISYRQTPTYVATTRLLVKPISADASGIAPVPNMNTEAEVVQSIRIAERVVGDLELSSSPHEILDGVTVVALPETEVLDVSYTSSDPRFAADAATSFAFSYIQDRRESTKDALLGAARRLTKRLNDARQKLGGVNETLRVAQRQGDAGLVDELSARRNSLTTTIALLEEQLDATVPDREVELGGGEILEEAPVPTTPSAPNHRSNITFGVILGAILSIGAGFAKDRLDTRFRSRTDAETVLGIPTLAAVPRFKTKRRRSGPAILQRPNSPSSEAYRTLRTNIQFLSLQQGIGSVVITSPASGDGKTVTSVNLAIAIAQSGKKTVLVSADLRRPTVEKHFENVNNARGLATWLDGTLTDIKAVVQRTNVDNVFLVPSGPVPSNPAELLTSERLGELIKELESFFDLVIFDSVPTLSLADAAILASATDATILVLNAASTKKHEALLAIGELERVGATVLGSVLNLFDRGPATRYYYGYYPPDVSGSKNGSGNGALSTPGDRKGRTLLGRRK